MKLKTLKDFTSWAIVGGRAKLSITPEELKAEAIRWVKPNDWSKFWKWCKANKGFDYESKDIQELHFIEAWIEYFFNITEEDLSQFDIKASEDGA